MKVIDLVESDVFQKECQRLRELTERSIKPDLVVGVLTGGAYVVDAMGYPETQQISLVKRQRQTTKIKSSPFFKPILASLPRFLANALRVIEVVGRELIFKLGKKNLESGEVFPIGELAIKENSVILIVDDAVDSGGTFVDVIRYVKNVCPSSVVYTACLSATFRNPGFSPDFILYERTLIRGPWALDS